MALALWCLAAALGTTSTLLGSETTLRLALVSAALLFVLGLTVLVFEPRLKMWIFDRQMQQMWILRKGGLGAMRLEATMALGDIEGALGTTASALRDSPIRRLNAPPKRLFEGDFQWEGDRQRAVCRVYTFLKGSQ